MAARKRGRQPPSDMHELTSYFTLNHLCDKKPKVAPPPAPSFPIEKSYLSILATRYMKPQAIVIDLAKTMCDPQLVPFITKFQPKTEQDLLNKELKSVLRTFISSFQDRISKLSLLSDGPNALLLTGPSGCGKTSSIRAIAKSMNLILMEMSTKDQRHSQALRGVIGEATQTRKVESVGRKAAILLDDVDIVFECEKGFYGTVWELVKKTKFPILMTANAPPSDLTDRSLISMYELPSVSDTEALLKLSIICKLEKLDIPDLSLPALYKYCDNNMGKALNCLQVRDLGLMVGLQKDVEALESIEGRVSARNAAGNWPAHREFGEWLEFVYWNSESRQNEDIEEESALMDILSLYDAVTPRMRRSSYSEDCFYHSSQPVSLHTSAAEHEYRLSACTASLEAIVKPNMENAKKLVLVYKRRESAQKEWKNSKRKLSPHPFKCKKKSPVSVQSLPLQCDSFLD